jgi:hypothetical protein
LPDPFVAIISAGRAQNVPAMDALVDTPHVWIVPTGQAADYRYAGAEKVMETASTQDTHQRNYALDVAGHRWCVQLDDDLKKLRYCVPGEKGQPITISLAIGMMIAAAEDNGAFYAGIAPTDNAYFTRVAVNTAGFIRSAFTVYRPGSQLRYDHQFPVKGDYDLTCQHLQKYGRVARVDGLLGSFAYGQGSGGCVAYRTPEMERDVIAKLMAKWPQAITPNPKRENEVRLRWPGSAPVTEQTESLQLSFDW